MESSFNNRFELVNVLKERSELCSIFEDYLKCSYALYYWSKSTKPAAIRYRLEYATLLTHLKSEMVEKLKDHG